MMGFLLELQSMDSDALGSDAALISNFSLNLCISSTSAQC
jgi:hypothetical protein